MKRFGRSCCRVVVLSGFLTWGLASGAVAQTADSARETTAPAGAFESADAVVVVGSVRQTLDKAERFVTLVSPETTSPQLKSQVGEFLGDKSLSGLSEQAGAVYIVFTQQPGVVFLEVSSAKADAYMKALQQHGLQVARQGQTLVVSTTPEALKRGQEMAPQVTSTLLKQPRAQGVRVSVPVGRLLSERDEQIRGMLTSLPQMIAQGQEMAAAQMGQEGPPTTVTARVLEAELRLVHQLAKKLQRVELNLDLTDQGVRMDALFVPKQGTAQSMALQAKLPKPEALRQLLPMKGAMRGVAVFDAQVVMKLLSQELNGVLDEMKLEGSQRKQMVEWIQQWGKVMGNGSAFDMLLPGEKALAGSAVTLVSDPKAALAMIQQMPETMKTSGFENVYRAMGIPFKLSFTPNVRQVNGVAVHRLRIDFETSPTVAKSMISPKLLGSGNYDLAFVGNYLIYAIGEQPIEPLIDAAKSGKNPQSQQLASERVFGPGANMYLDYAVGQALQAVAEAGAAGPSPQATEQLKKLAAAVSGAEPTAFAWFVSAEGYRAKMLIPTSLISGFAKASRVERRGEDTDGEATTR